MKQTIKEKLDAFESNYDKLKWLCTAQKSNYAMYLADEKFGLKFLLDWTIAQTPLLDSPTYELKTRIYWALNKIQDFPLCEVCHGKMLNVNVYSVMQGYKKHICASKSCKDKYAQMLRSKAMLERFGTTSNFGRKEVIDKISQNNIAAFGNACPANNAEVRQKIKSANLAKYGVESYSQTAECKDKVRQTNLKNLGVGCTFQSNAVKEKSRSTCRRRYGTGCPQQSEAFKEQKKHTLASRHGEDYAKVLWGSKGNIGQSRRAYKQFILQSKEVEPMFSEEHYIEERSKGSNSFLFKCKHCGKEFWSPWDNGMSRHCPYCKITEVRSSKEEHELYLQILQYADSKYEVKHNDRTLLLGKELDIYVPSRHLAIEFDGLYWHNDSNLPDHSYHLSKTELCECNGVQLVHVFENEWKHKQDIVKSRLKSLLGIYDKTVFARKCEVRAISSNESKEFQDKNHIQGAVNAKVSLGLLYGDELVSLMTFGKCRFDRHHDWEMLRFCSKLGYHVPGAAGKLLKFFERNFSPASIVSYADRRWSQGKLYEALGFKLDHKSPPNYWYFKSYEQKQLDSRVKFQKHKQKAILEKFDESKTEVENMKANGYCRIFDCGSLVYEKLYNDII